jgi:hypothetical protein
MPSPASASHRRCFISGIAANTLFSHYAIIFIIFDDAIDTHILFAAAATLMPPCC